MDRTTWMLLCITVIVAAVAMFISSLASIFTHMNTSYKCWEDLVEGRPQCTPVCNNGSFGLPGMANCRQWLTCEDIKEVVLSETILQSIVKQIYLAKWEGHDVVLSRLSSPDYENDFNHNIFMLKSLGPNPFTVQFLGNCSRDHNIIVTQYHKLGSALSLHHHLSDSLQQHNTPAVRLNLCISYATILAYLHNSSMGIRVMCDSSSLEKTLSQYLLTNDLQLVLNDLDATPEVSNSHNAGVVCGHRQLTGSFVAPEQLWPYQDKQFNETLMPPYDEKTDIWKIPDVCNWFLGNTTDSDIVKFKLFNIHKRCKDIRPSNRPSAKSVTKMYKDVWDDLFNDTLSK